MTDLVGRASRRAYFVEPTREKPPCVTSLLAVCADRAAENSYAASSWGGKKFSHTLPRAWIASHAAMTGERRLRLTLVLVLRGITFGPLVEQRLCGGI